MKRHQRVSIGSLHDAFGTGNPDANCLFRKPSGSMPVDIMTEPLAVEVHWRCMRELGMGRLGEGPPLEEDGAVVPSE